jgi:hypothetical protein
MINRFRPAIGSRQLSSKTSGSVADATRSARNDMATIIRNYVAFCEHMQESSSDVILAALEPAFDLSQTYVPVDTGELKDSGYLEVITWRGIPVVEIGYGLRGEPPYAAMVHENLEAQHEAPTQAKYLERALDETMMDAWTIIEEGYKRAGGFS